jgi:hypothetical protein
MKKVATHRDRPRNSAREIHEKEIERSAELAPPNPLTKGN